jgi:hypothetical protein
MLRLVRVHELTAEDIRWLEVGARACKWFDSNAQKVIARAETGDIGLYRVEGEAKGMITVAVDDSDLFIESLAGVGFLKNAQAIREQLKWIATLLRKKRLVGWVARDGLAALYDGFAQPVATLYVEELNHGRA